MDWGLETECFSAGSENAAKTIQGWKFIIYINVEYEIWNLFVYIKLISNRKNHENKHKAAKMCVGLFLFFYFFGCF